MIISQKHRYLFIEVPHTGSTAISQELIENYDGQPILHKHAHYNEFLKSVNNRGKRPFVFAGIRNPLDDVVSIYFKFKTNHKGNFTDLEKLTRNGGFVTQSHTRRFNFIQDSNADFSTYLKEFFNRPYTTDYSWTYKELDFVIHFENLQVDFAQAIRLVGLEPVRAVPLVNKTAAKGDDFISYYDPAVYQRARNVFGPYMEKWGYKLPAHWGDEPISRLSHMEFQIIEMIGRFCLNRLRWSPARCHQVQQPVRQCFRGLRKIGRQKIMTKMGGNPGLWPGKRTRN